MKLWGGLPIVAVLVLLGLYITDIGVDSNKNLSYQQVSSECKLDRQESCDQLIRFGVAPNLYINNEAYQRLVDTRAIEALNNNSDLSYVLAKFTLDFAGSRG